MPAIPVSHPRSTVSQPEQRGTSYPQNAIQHAPRNIPPELMSSNRPRQQNVSLSEPTWTYSDVLYSGLAGLGKVAFGAGKLAVAVGTVMVVAAVAGQTKQNNQGSKK